MKIITPIISLISFILIKDFSSNRENKEKYGKLKIKFLNRLTNSISIIIQEIEEYKIKVDLEK
jgi:hypothetical protein